jgi:hypothetical protein
MGGFNTTEVAKKMDAGATRESIVKEYGDLAGKFYDTRAKHKKPPQKAQPEATPDPLGGAKLDYGDEEQAPGAAEGSPADSTTAQLGGAEKPPKDVPPKTDTAPAAPAKTPPPKKPKVTDVEKPEDKPAGEVDEGPASRFANRQGSSDFPTGKKKPPSPKERSAFVDHMKYLTSLGSKIKEDDLKAMYGDKVGKIMKRYEDSKANVRKGQMWDTFAQALGQIAAGLYGMNTGQDLSGAKAFSTVDWEKQMDGLTKDIDVQLDELRSKRREFLQETRNKAEVEAIKGRTSYQKKMVGLKGKEVTAKITANRLKAEELAKEKLARRTTSERKNLLASYSRWAKAKGDVKTAEGKRLEATLQSYGFSPAEVNNYMKERTWKNAIANAVYGFFNKKVPPEYEYKDPEDVDIQGVVAAKEGRSDTAVAGGEQPPGEATANDAVDSATPAPAGKIKVMYLKGGKWIKGTTTQKAYDAVKKKAPDSIMKVSE